MNGLALALGRIPPRRLVFAVFIGTWVIRALFLSIPDPLSIDEVSALSASEYGTASRFMATGSWAERWDIANHFRQWHILWTAPHSIWGYVLPSNGQMAYALTQLSALIAMLALAGAARHLYGEPGFLLSLLVASVSPLFLNYTIRALGTMPATMWVCLALFLFTLPRRGIWIWIAGGLCFGLAFGASFGAGTAIVAMSCGLGLGLARLLLTKDVTKGEKAWTCGVAPLAGALAAIAPLVPVEFAAREAGAPYVEFLLHHTMLVLDVWLGPYGLWFRHLLELDPLLEILLFVAVIGAFRTRVLERSQKAQLALACLLIIGLLIASTDQAPLRVFVSLALFAVIGLGVSVTGILARGWLAVPGVPGEMLEVPDVRAPFDRRSLIVAIVVLAVVLSAWRNLSNMPRLVFPAWPLLILGILWPLLRALPRSHYPAIVRGTAVLGALLFLIGAGATYHAKSARTRASVHSVRHPYLGQVTYQELWDFRDVARNFGRLSTRARYELVVIGPPAILYPSSVYEEDPFKIVLYRQALRRFNLDDVLAAEQIPWGRIFFEESPSTTDPVPPAGTPEVPERVRGVDTDGKPFTPRVHSYRGLELRFPARTMDQPAEISAIILLPADPGNASTLGFEFMALTPDVPAGARLVLSTLQGDRRLGSIDVPIVGSLGRQADKSLALDELPAEKPDPFRLVQWPIRPEARVEEIRIVARLEVQPGTFSPALSCYIRRPYIDHSWTLLQPRAGHVSRRLVVVALGHRDHPLP